ncbi:unnamed protein product [Rotaria magnacalcarata]|nr:unnamed protein product [Rotaria magnacalcarata]
MYEIDNQNINQQVVHFRAEFYIFTCHCWLDINSILAATDHGHIFWIHDGSIRSDINLEESITVDINLLKASTSNESSNRQSMTTTPPSKINLLENGN